MQFDYAIVTRKLLFQFQEHLVRNVSRGPASQMTYLQLRLKSFTLSLIKSQFSLINVVYMLCEDLCVPSLHSMLAVVNT